MAIQKITADVISSDAITTASISDSAITAAKLAGTLDLTGKTITVATASSGDNDTSAASTAFVQQEIASLVDSAPGTLNTLNELAAALGDDANFSTTVTNSIALKAPLASPDFTGDVTFDTSTLVVDATNNRVGIGASSPSAPLDLETAGNTADGTYYSTFTINNTGSSTWSRIRFDRSGVAKWGLALGTDDKFKISNLFTNGTSSSPDDNALVISNASNVGIGTDSPAQALVVKRSSGNTYLDISRATQSQGQVALQLTGGTSGTNWIMYQDTSSNDLRFYGNSGNRMTIDTSGNVGIGDTSPAAKLEIKQGSSNWYEGIRINRSDNTTQFGTFSNNSGATFIGAADSAGGNNNAIVFGTSTNGTTFTERARISSDGDLLVGTTQNEANTDANDGGGTAAFFGMAVNRSSNHAVNISSRRAAPLVLNRMANDGSIITFNQAGTTDGQINTLSGRMAIGSNDTGIFFDSTRDCLSPFTMTGNDGRDGAIDIGRDAVRFKDFYLTGIIDLENAFRIRSESGQTGTLGFNRNPADGTHLGQSGLQRFQINGPFSGSDFLDFQNYNSSGTYTGGFRIVEGSIQGYPQVVSKPTYSFIGDSNTGMTRPTGDTLQFVTGGSEAMRIDSSGRTLINTTNPSPANVGNHYLVVERDSSTFGIAVGYVADTASRQQITFYNNNGTVGSISTSGSSTSYNTSSDYRLKQNVDYDFNALDRVAQLKPARFNFIADADTTVDGFLAHEVQDIVPEAITGEKDGEEMQSIDQSKLVPLLTKAIQEQQTIIDDLKSRIETLEG